MVDGQPFMRAADGVFDASALLFLLLIPVIWRTRPANAGAGASSAAAGAAGAAGLH